MLVFASYHLPYEWKWELTWVAEVTLGGPYPSWMSSIVGWELASNGLGAVGFTCAAVAIHCYICLARA
uniref:Uncharacterized protein n=1 Tax=Romanomermis culicivorax TaxID=13658 RepID=A0A915KE29_ROMCU